VAILGTYEALPYDRGVPKRGKVQIRFGKPLVLERHYDTPADRFVLRSVTDEVMYELMLLSGQEYVDEYGSKVKVQIDRRKAQGAQPAGEAGAVPTEPADVVVVPDVSEPAESRPPDASSR
jgi:1-acyl-sn-glycerol-3-phosphate acyltransferase